MREHVNLKIIISFVPARAYVNHRQSSSFKKVVLHLPSGCNKVSRVCRPSAGIHHSFCHIIIVTLVARTFKSLTVHECVNNAHANFYNLSARAPTRRAIKSNFNNVKHITHIVMRVDC